MFIGIHCHIYWNKVYLLECVIIFIGTCNHINFFIGICYRVYWNMLSHLWEFFTYIGIHYHIYWNMLPYFLNTLSNLLECVIIFIGIYYLIYWNMLSYLLEYVIIFICLLINNNSDKLHPKHYKRKISMRNISEKQQKH